MSSRTTSAKIGNWLFRWRSYLPLLLLAIVIPAMRGFSYPFGSHAYDRAWEMLCLAVSLLGLALRAHTIGCAPAGTSGRNTRRQVAESLNTTGMYSLTRNPLYLGNYLMVLGVVMFTRSWWPVLIYVAVYFLYYKMIIAAEEEFLRDKFGNKYEAYARRTPLFIPNLLLWRKPEVSFSFRNVLKREYSGLFGIVASFTALELLADYVAERRFVLDPLWTVIFTCGLALYLTFRTLKKKTRVLHVSGR